METFIAHNVLSPYREVVLREFQRHRVPLNMEVEMPTVETHPQAGAAQRRCRLPAAHVRGAGDRAEAAARNQSDGAERRPQDPPRLPGQAGVESCCPGFPRSGEGPRVRIIQCSRFGVED